MAIPKNTKKAFIVKAQQRWGNKYDCSKVDYVNSRTSVVIHCKKHNVDFEQTPKAHFAAKHHSCSECYEAEAGIFQNKWREKLAATQRLTCCPFLRYTALINQVFVKLT
ncbi:hypothetical protein [Vibrio sp. F13]|uniref:hypothetical protein n=1 Tax=Vibrio sp. F13 TaxID=2070777 RepID=UPI0010BD651D|nr:hypothetical protein [Vibrio sp. F13]TKG01675.1 hypothetical protein FCV76_10810 [Vibrio sp. F13]